MLEAPDPSKAETRDERVQVIFELMLDGRFGWGSTGELASLWGVAPVTVRGYTAEAIRIFRREVGAFGDEFKARIMAQLESVGRGALERTEEVVDAAGHVHTVHKPDHRTARMVVMDLAQLSGLLVTKHQVSVTEMSDDEIRSQLRTYGLEVRKVDAQEGERGDGDASARGEAGASSPAPVGG